jgi:hypothetical protein
VVTGDFRVEVGLQRPTLNRETIDDRRDDELRTRVEKVHDADVLRDTIAFAAQRLMEIEVGVLTGAALGENLQPGW